MLSDTVISQLADRLVVWAAADASVDAFAAAADARKAKPDRDPLFMTLTRNVCRASVVEALAYWIDCMPRRAGLAGGFSALRAALYDPDFVDGSAIIHHLVTNQYIWDVFFSALYPLFDLQSGAGVRDFFGADFFKPLAKIAALAARPFLYANGGGDWTMYCGIVPDAWPFTAMQFVGQLKENAYTKKVFIARVKASGAWLLLSLRTTSSSSSSEFQFSVTNLLSENKEWDKDAASMDAHHAGEPGWTGIATSPFVRRAMIYSAEDGALQLYTDDSTAKLSLLRLVPALNKFDLAVNLGDYLAFGVDMGDDRAVFNMDRINMLARFMRLLDVDAANPKFLRGHRIQKVWWLIHNDKQAVKALNERDLIQLKFRVLQLFGLESKDPFVTDNGFWGRTWGDTMELIELICEVAVDDKRDMRDCVFRGDDGVKHFTPIADPRYTAPTVPLEALVGLDLVDAPSLNLEAAWEAEAAALGVQGGAEPAGGGLRWSSTSSSSSSSSSSPPPPQEEEKEEAGKERKRGDEVKEKTGFTPDSKKGRPSKPQEF